MDNNNSAGASLEEQQALNTLLASEHYLVAPVLAFVVSGICFVLIAAVGFSGFAFLLAFPSLMAAVAVRYVADLVRLRFRVMCAIVVFATSIFFLSGNIAIGSAVAFIGALIFVVVSERPLDSEQRKLLYRWKVGLISRG